MLLNVVKLQTKGFAFFIYLAICCTFNVVLERLLEVLVADSYLRFQNPSSTESYRSWLYRMVCAFDFSEPQGWLKSSRIL